MKIRILLFPWLLYLCGCSGLANFLLLHPSQHSIPTPAKTLLLSQSEHKNGHLGQLELFKQDFGPPGPLAFALLSLPGNAGRAERMVAYSAKLISQAWPDAIPQQRFRVLSVQYPGFGQSAGPATLARIGAAAEVGYQQLLQTLPPDVPVYVHGLSMGTTAALHLARNLALHPQPPAGLIVEKPPDLWRQILWQNGWWNAWLISLPLALSLPENTRNDLNTAEVKNIPALFLVATRDYIVPPSYAMRISKAYAGPKVVLTASIGHNSAISRENTPKLAEQLHWLLDQSKKK